MWAQLGGPSNVLWQWPSPDEGKSPPDVSSFNASPPRSCSFLLFLSQSQSFWASSNHQALHHAVVPHVSCPESRNTEEGLQAGYPSCLLLNAGPLFLHWCILGLSNCSHCLHKYRTHVFSRKVLPCLSLLSHLHSEKEDKDPQFPPERTVKGVYLRVSTTRTHRMVNICFNVALEDGSRLEVTTKRKPG